LSVVEVNTPSSVDELFANHDAYLRRRGRTASTRSQYSYPLHSFRVWLGSRSIGNLLSADIELFLAWWDDQFERRYGRLPCAATTRGTICALRSLFSYLENTGLLVTSDGRPARNPMRTIEGPSSQQRPNDFLRPHEDEALLGADIPDHRRRVVWLLRHTGLRVGEARSLMLADIDLAPGQETITVRSSKSAAGRRTIPLMPHLLPIAHEQIARVREMGFLDPTAPVLCTRHGTAMTSTQLWRTVKRAAETAGVRVVGCTCGTTRQDRHLRDCPRTRSGDNRSLVTPHTLRRTYGSDLINRGLRLETVSKLLGHASTTVTERAYAQLLPSTIRSELTRALTASVPR
jgi:integrase